MWKTIEFSALNMYGDMLWKSYAHECVFNNLKSFQLEHGTSIGVRLLKILLGRNFQNQGFFNVFGIIEMLDQNPKNSFSMKIGIIRVLSM